MSWNCILVQRNGIFNEIKQEDAHSEFKNAQLLAPVIPLDMGMKKELLSLSFLVRCFIKTYLHLKYQLISAWCSEPWQKIVNIACIHRWIVLF